MALDRRDGVARPVEPPGGSASALPGPAPAAREPGRGRRGRPAPRPTGKPAGGEI